mmetsp:Transcript_77/g.207  ORF Transcript_77/g.207 Transcript_77/m.207 type:complete len:83 (+) Transcript_77:81-329(+)
MRVTTFSSCPPPTSTASYFDDHFVGFDTRLGDGFLDPVRMPASAAMPSPASLALLGPGTHGTHEVLIVDARRRAPGPPPRVR